MNQIRTSLLLGLTLITLLSSWSACNIVNGKAYGDWENVLVHQGARPALKIRNHVTESGIVSGATVYADSSLNFSGIANGDVTVNNGGRLSVTGVVNAPVRNNGGFVEIKGIIDRLISNGGNSVVSVQLIWSHDSLIAAIGGIKYSVMILNKKVNQLNIGITIQRK